MAVAVAVLTIEPASRSVWSVVRVAVQRMVAFGASVAPRAGVQLSADSRVSGSVTRTLVRVWLPLFVATKVYVTLWPTAETLVGAAVFTTVIAGFSVPVTVTAEVSVTRAPVGPVPVAVAALVTEPASSPF